MRYTTQKRLGRFGARWGCFGTNLINVIENEMGRMMTIREIQQAIGVFFLSETVLIANYKHHEKIGNEPKGWGASANPEWHFLVRDMHAALEELQSAFRVHRLTHKYDIVEHSTSVGSHFVLRIDQKDIINPDPAVKIKTVKSVRPFDE